MRKTKLLVLFAILAWLIPFLISFLVYPLKNTGDPLFETTMAVVLTLTGILLSRVYFKGIKAGFLKEGLVFGIVLMVVSIFLDLLMFMWGPMKMTFVAYLKDIGLTYLIYPVISTGLGSVLARHV